MLVLIADPSKVLFHHGWRPAILPALERLPDQHGRLLQKPQGRKELLRCDNCNGGISIWQVVSCIKIESICSMNNVDGQCSSFRASTQRPTRWSYAPAPPTSRICWIRTPPSIPLSSWRYIGDCFISTDASLPGCTIRSPECHPGVHVCWRGEISCFLKKLHVLFFFGRNDYNIMAWF